MNFAAVRLASALALWIVAFPYWTDAPAAPATVSAAQFGAVGDGITDDTSSLQRALDSGKLVTLASGKSYSVSSRLRIPSGGGIVGERSAEIVARAAGFGNADFTIAGRYRADSTVLDASGMTAAPFAPHRNIVLRGFSLRFESTDGRVLDAIVARNVEGLLIEQVEISGFSVGTAIRVASVTGKSSISRNRIRDFSSNTVFAGPPGQKPQITGIEVDNDLVERRPSTGLLIAGNHISNLTVGPVFLAAYGYETDGINIAHPETRRYVIRGNLIRNTGEAIDTFGSDGTISANEAVDSYIFGIKLIHGASRNRVSGNRIVRSGLAGIIVAGSTSAKWDTANNNITGNTIADIDPHGAWATNTTACVQLSDRPEGTKVQANVFSGNVCDPGIRGKWTVVSATTGNPPNVFRDNRYVRSGTEGEGLCAKLPGYAMIPCRR